MTSMKELTPTRKLALTAIMFSIALVLVYVATVTKVVAPLFAAWAPLLVVPFVLTRPELNAGVGPALQAEDAEPALDASVPQLRCLEESGSSESREQVDGPSGSAAQGNGPSESPG